MLQTTEQNARQMIANLKTRNIDKMMGQYADDATFQVPSLETPLKGKEAIRAYFTGSFTAFPDWTMVVSKVIISGGETIVVSSVHGTHTGRINGTDGAPVEPTHRRFTQDQLTRVIFNQNDKVQSLRAYGIPTESSVTDLVPG